MSPEKHEVLMAIRAGFDSLKFSFGIRKPLEVVDFEFNSSHEMPIETIQPSCGCQDAQADNHRVWGKLTLGSNEKYRAAGDVFERNGEFYHRQKHQGNDYFVPTVPGDMILANEESEKEFTAVKAAKESKAITVYFDDGEQEYLVDEKRVRKVNTEKAQIPLIIEGWVILE